MLIGKVMNFVVIWYVHSIWNDSQTSIIRVNAIFHIIVKSVQIKVELLMDLVHLGLESAVFVSKTVFNNHHIQLY